ncbi:MAG TPA: DUF6130 family protein [Chitinophagaceae bacterium]|nr:DUF6130 family protein [Chitinophagaceae bacterium]
MHTDSSNNSKLAESISSARNAPAVVQLDAEPPAKLIVDAPLAGPLQSGRVVIQYRTEHIRIVPVYGEGAMDVSPRVGHLHLTVDNAPWHWLDASAEPITMNGFTPGKHVLLLELADPMHKIIDSTEVEFIIPVNTK